MGNGKRKRKTETENGSELFLRSCGLAWSAPRSDSEIQLQLDWQGLTLRTDYSRSGQLLGTTLIAPDGLYSASMCRGELVLLEPLPM